ncbi:MAG TPA: glycosyl hydrolase [bacterium]|nr:glycosyl hydrolase [bacterium]
MEKDTFSFDVFSKSPVEYRPVPFLFLNHELQDNELMWQVKEIKEKGLRGFFMHPRPGLLTPYMSVEFRKKIRLMVEEAEKHGIEAWLYDEDPYPSGAAGGKVIYHHPEYRSRTLNVKTQIFHGGEKIKFDLPIGHVIAIFAVPQETDKNKKIINLTEFAGPVREEWAYIRRYNTYYGSMPADTFPHWRSDATGIKNRLVWNCPEGKWKIISFVECYETSYWGPWGAYVDLLNSDAVDDFIQKTHEVYKKDLGKYFGKTIPGIFTDEPKWIGWLPWSSKFIDYFKKIKGYSIVDYLYMLVDGDSEKERKIRFDYWDVLTGMLKESFFDRISKWCEKNKISFTGHVSPEEEPDLGVVYLGDLMQLAKSFQIPGTDIITSRIGTNEYPVINVGPKLISSVARQQARQRIIAECFALEEWDFTLSKMKKIADFMMCLGVNLITPHGFYYSIDGHRKKEACPSQFYQTTYWQYYEEFSKYIGRVCYMLTRFDYPVEFALLYPTSSLWHLLPADREKAKEISDSFVFINNLLVHNKRQFDFVDDIDFVKAQVGNGTFTIGKMKYNALVVPPLRYMPDNLVEKLKEFSENGGKVLFLGEKIKGVKTELISPEIPENIAYLDEKQRQKESQKIKNVLEEFVPPLVELHGTNCEDVFVSARKGKDCSIYFFANCGEEIADFSVKLRDKEQLELWDSSTGQRYATGGELGNFRIILQSFQSIFAVSGSGKNLLNPSFILEKHQLCNLDEWDFEICDDNVLYLGLWNIVRENIDEFFDAEQRYKNIGHPVLPPTPAGRIKDLSKTNIRWLENDFDISYPSTLCYKINFFCYGEPEKMELVWEKSSIKGKYRIFIDEQEIPLDKVRQCKKYDIMNMIVDITQYFRKQKPFYTPDVRTISVFVDVKTPEDGLLEPMRVFGDFIVKKTGDMGMGAEIKAGIKPCKIAGSWTDAGFPYYSGSAIYRKSFNIDNIENCRYFLRIDNLYDIAEIEINGKKAGTILWNPPEVEITGALKKGENKIMAKITNSLFNMLEGKPKPSGIIGSVKILQTKRSSG